MRMIPDMLDITADVMELCPNAYYFNYSNPMSIICRAIKKKTGARMIGLCHGVWGSEWEIADFVGLPRDECTSYYAGINHLTYIYDFRHKGKDIWPLVREKLAIIKASGYNYADPSRKLPAPEGVAKDMRNPFCWSIFDDHGAFVAPGDYHVIEFYPERFPRGEFYGGVMGMGIPNTFEDLIIGGDAAFEQMREWAFSKEKLPDEAYHTHREKLVEMIDSIEGDKRIIFPVNVPNEGAIASLPKDAVLEIPAAAGSLGFCPLMLTGFSDVLAGIINKQLSIIEVVVEAALNGSRGLFIDSILMGGYITDRVQVEKMVDDLLLEHKKYLPQF